MLVCITVTIEEAPVDTTGKIVGIDLRPTDVGAADTLEEKSPKLSIISNPDEER